MKIPEGCVACLYKRQARRTDNPEYLRRIRELLDNRKPSDTSPYMVYQFNRVYEELFGKLDSYAEIKKKYNDFVLQMEMEVRTRIEASDDPLCTALSYSRVGNYIDFGAMSEVDEKEFLALFENGKWSAKDDEVYRSFVSQCENAKSFLLICDNCGEIVLDKLVVEQLKKRFPAMQISVLVRGAEVLNDVTREDADYVGMDRVANVIDNGYGISGTVYEMLPKEAKDCFDNADVILAKGQGNYESLSGFGMHIFYLFLCKCKLFVNLFEVEKFTGMFLEE